MCMLSCVCSTPSPEVGWSRSTVSGCDLAHTRLTISPWGASVDIVEDYKYLGIDIDNELDWAKNTETLHRKAHSCLYWLIDCCSRQQPLVKSWSHYHHQGTGPLPRHWTVGCWPQAILLPREFSQVITLAVYMTSTYSVHAPCFFFHFYAYKEQL